jgi:hypothetical protein
MLDGGPDDFQIDKKYSWIATLRIPRICATLELGMLFEEVRRAAVDLVHGFADDLDISDNRILSLWVLLKRRQVRDGLKIAYRSLNRLGNVFQIIFDALRVLHRGCAFCSTSSRNFGGNPLGVKTATGTPSSSRRRSSNRQW